MSRRSARSRPATENLEGPVVAIVGRPNVGKSTLFNRLVGAPLAVVGPQEGITRDRNYAGTEWTGRRFVLVDTGGILVGHETPLSETVTRQVKVAIEESDLVLFVVEAGPGPTDLDLGVSRLLHHSGRPVLVVANKVDSPADESELYRFLALGLGDPVPVSAQHGRLVGDLLDEIVARIAAAAADVPEEAAPAGAAIRVAFVGRPNVGKSSLVNAVVGEERVVVDAAAGTTRDAVDTRMERGGQTFVLVDTAGLRRPARREPGVEYWASLRSERAVGRCDIVFLVIEAAEGIMQQDARIAGMADEQGRGLVVVVNKWDLVETGRRDTESYERYLRRELRFAPYARTLFVSARTGEGVGRLLVMAAEVAGEQGREIARERLEEIVEDAIEHRAPTKRGRPGKVRAAKQVGVRPPRFALYVNDPDLFSDQYLRYLGNRMRMAYPFRGTPIRIMLRRGRPADEVEGAVGATGAGDGA